VPFKFNNLRRYFADGVVVVSLEASIVMDFYPPLPKDGVEEEEQEVGAVQAASSSSWLDTVLPIK
jgi:hypothetical protein